MSRRTVALTLAATLIPAAALACGDAQGTDTGVTGWYTNWSVAPQEATVDQVAAWTRAKTAVPVDANGAKVRAAEGVIPGAVLLTSAKSYEARELPADKATQLVFYCANELCGASKQAAARAQTLGYTNVAVLPVGIKGWKAARQPTAKPTS